MNQRRPLLPDFRQTTDGPQLIRVEVAADLLPGQSADCHPVFWDGTNWTVATSITLKLYDPFYRCCALAAHGGSNPDRLWALKLPDMFDATGSAGFNNNRYEVAGEYGLKRLGKVITSAITAGGSGSVELYTASGATWTDVGTSVTAYDPRTTGSNLAVGHRVYLDFISRQWMLGDGDPCAA
jgi:hypothetical protein